MLSSRERETPREFQRQFVSEDQSSVRSFHATQRRSSSDRCRPVSTTAALVSTALIVLMLVGPNVLTEQETIARRTPPAPRRCRATPWSLDELAGLIGRPAARMLALLGMDESTTALDLWLATPETRHGNDFSASQPPWWRTPSAAA